MNIVLFHDIKISKGKLGNPKIKYKKEVRKKFGIKKSHLSITHDAGFAIAVVVNVEKRLIFCIIKLKSLIIIIY